MMKTVRRNPLLKTIAFILAVIVTVTAFCSVIAIGILTALGGYSAPHRFKEEIIGKILQNEQYRVHDYMEWDSDNRKILQEGGVLELPEHLQAENSNLRFTVTDQEGNTVLANESAPSAKAQIRPLKVLVDCTTKTIRQAVKDEEEANALLESLEIPHHFVISTILEPQDNGTYLYTVSYQEYTYLEYTVSYSAAEPMETLDFVYFGVQLTRFVTAMRWEILVIGICSIIVMILLYLYLFFAAGYRKGSEKPASNFIDRIPLELYLFIVGSLMTILISGCVFSFMGAIELGTTDLVILFTVLALLAAFLVSALFLSFLLTVAARIKCHTLLKNTIFWRLLAPIWKYVRKGWMSIQHYLKHLPIYWKSGLATVILLILELIVLASDSTKFIAFCMVLGNLLIIPLALYSVVQYKRLQEGAEELARGNTDYKMDTTNMVADFKIHADALNGIGEGMQKAVNERMKSERFKTELITNVSHDIKTPLTSIINYVDLLKKQEIDSPAAKEYIEVLDRQSARLKRLIEDLIEASKASTGNVSANIEPLDLNLLLHQSIAEFQGKLDAKELSVILKLAPDADSRVLADGRLLSRVCENLLGNVCKYAQPGTRVYLSAEVQAEDICLIVKNTSAYPLNISSEELMERFTRGDASRHTEGSGLGLSIARNLIELQKGSFAITIDGDLFKVAITLPKA